MNLAHRANTVETPFNDLVWSFPCVMSFFDDDSVPATAQRQASQPPSSSPSEDADPSLASTPQSPLQQTTSSELTERRRLGALHLHPATVQELFEIDRFIYGQYDLVDGVLIWNDTMSESNINKNQAKNLQYHFRKREQHNPVSNRSSTLEASIGIPTKRYVRSQPSSSNAAPVSDDSDESSTSRRRDSNYSIVKADLAIGRGPTDEERARLSPSSQQLTFPLGFKPEVVVECTSTNESRDMIEKPKLYGRAQIPKYVVINNKRRSKHKAAAVHEGNLRNGRYEGLEIELQGTDKVDLGPIGTLEAKDCIDPGDVDKRAHEEDRKQLVRISEAEKARREADKARREADKARDDERRRRQKAEKERHEADKARDDERRRRQKAEQARHEADKARREADKARDDERRRRQKAEQRRQKTEQRRQKTEQRNQELLKRMREAGMVVSDSSSSSKSGSSTRRSPSPTGSSSQSPPRKRNK
ncbi:RhoGAP domain containing protein [Gracilaria domingensis]|nr:RhoGAP domain containing protein [Gracilaria domingensis]